MVSSRCYSSLQMIHWTLFSFRVWKILNWKFLLPNFSLFTERFHLSRHQLDSKKSSVPFELPQHVPRLSKSVTFPFSWSWFYRSNLWEVLMIKAFLSLAQHFIAHRPISVSKIQWTHPIQSYHGIIKRANYKQTILSSLKCDQTMVSLSHCRFLWFHSFVYITQKW